MSAFLPFAFPVLPRYPSSIIASEICQSILKNLDFKNHAIYFKVLMREHSDLLQETVGETKCQGIGKSCC